MAERGHLLRENLFLKVADFQIEIEYMTIEKPP